MMMQRAKTKLLFIFFIAAMLLPLFFARAQITDEPIKFFPSELRGNWSNREAIQKNNASDSQDNRDFNQKNSSYPNPIVVTNTETQLEQTQDNQTTEADQPQATQTVAPQPPTDTPAKNNSEKQTDNSALPDTPPVPVPQAPQDTIPDSQKSDVQTPATSVPDTTQTPATPGTNEQSFLHKFLSWMFLNPAFAKDNQKQDSLSEQTPEHVTETEKSNSHVESALIADGFEQSAKYIELKNARLSVSFGHELSEKGELIFDYYKNDEWHEFYTLLLETNEVESPLRLPLNMVNSTSDLQNLKIRLTYKDAFRNRAPIFVNTLLIEAEDANNASAQQSQLIRLISTIKNFSADEDAHFRFQFIENANRRNKSFLNFVKDTLGVEEIDLSKNTEAEIFSSDGTRIDSVVPELSYNDNTEILVNVPQNSQMKKPGAYTLKLKIFKKDKTEESDQIFFVGLLAVNTNKPVYAQNEQVYIQLGALDEKGNTLCDANLGITIKSPDGSLSDSPVMRSQTCGPQTVTQNPDYFSFYNPTLEGTYEISVINSDNGASANQWFTVTSAPQDFIVERKGPTRVFPSGNYHMEIIVTSKEDFTGSITDMVPSEFDVKETTDEKKIATAAGTEIRADVLLKKGEPHVFVYDFKPPDITPYIFLLGPTRIEKQNPTVTTTNDEQAIIASTVVYDESRQWQLASDATAIIEPNGDGTVTCAPTPSGTHYSAVDDHIIQPTAGDVTDYVICNSGKHDAFDLTTISNVNSVSSIDAWFYYKNRVNQPFSVSLWNSAGTVQYGTTQTLTSSQTTAWNRVSFSGLSLTQTQLDDLRITFANDSGLSGTGPVDTVYSLYANVLYTPNNLPPTVSNIHTNADQSITLNPDSPTNILVTGTVSDINGYNDITNVSLKFYRSGVSGAETCALDDDNCYSVSSCTLSNCSGNSCEADCTVSLQYFADPTDSGTPYALENWKAWMKATDSISQTGSAYDATGQDILTTAGFSFGNGSITFGSLDPGSTVELQNINNTVTARGNAKIRLYLKATDFINTSNPSAIIPAANLHFSVDSDLSFASSTAMSSTQNIDTSDVFSKRTASVQAVQKTIFFSLSVPHLPQGTYQNTVDYIYQTESLPW